MIGFPHIGEEIVGFGSFLTQGIDNGGVAAGHGIVGGASFRGDRTDGHEDDLVAGEFLRFRLCLPAQLLRLTEKMDSDDGAAQQNATACAQQNMFQANGEFLHWMASHLQFHICMLPPHGRDTAWWRFLEKLTKDR